MLRVFLLGEIGLASDEHVTDRSGPAGRQGRLVFGYLVCHRGRLVPREELAEALWGDEPPPTWEKALSVLVSKLRSTLGAVGMDGGAVLTNAFGCYRLDLPSDVWIDVVAAEAAADVANRSLASGDDDAAWDAAATAEALTRDPLMPGDAHPWIEERRAELAALRWRTLAVLAEVATRRKDTGAAVQWARQATHLDPFREAGYRLLMQALAGAGERAEALRVYEAMRRLLDEELGVDPSPETQAVYLPLLELAPEVPSRTTQTTEPPDDSAHVQTPGEPQVRPRTRRALMLIAVVAALAIVAVLASWLGTPSPPTVTANSVVALDDSGSVIASVPVGQRPVALTTASGSVWVANAGDRTVSRVDPQAHSVTATIPVAAEPVALASVGGQVWVGEVGGRVETIDPRYAVAASLPRLVPAEQPANLAYAEDGGSRSMVSAFGSAWILDPSGFVSRRSVEDGTKLASIAVGNDPSDIVAGSTAIWVSNRSDGTLTRIDPQTLLTTTVPVGHGPSAVVETSSGLWVANTGTSALVRVDTSSDAVTGTVAGGSGTTALLSTPTALWTSDAAKDTVDRHDPATGAVRSSTRLAAAPSALTSVDGTVWAALVTPTPSVLADGGTLRVSVENALPSLDPAAGGIENPQLDYLLCAGLVTYPDVAGPAGTRIVPDVAQSVPTPTDGGRTYSFTVRHGFRFSPPSNAPVTAATFKSSLERLLNPKLASPAAGDLADVVGYDDVVEGRTSHLRGVVASGDTLTIHLTKPNGGLLASLAGGDSCVVPDNTPAVPDLPRIPSAGPYYVAAYSPGQQMTILANPDYGGERPHRMTKIVISSGLDPSAALRQMEAGTSDYAYDGLPRDAGPALDAAYGVNSPAAHDGHQQYFISPANAVRWLHLNTSRPLFSRVNVRRAINYAIDRTALVDIGRRYAESNPFNSGMPTGALAPALATGATVPHVFPLRPDVATARKLAGDLHATAVMYTPNESPWIQEAQVIRTDLAAIGIDVQVQQFSLDDYFNRIGVRGAPFDLAVVGWGGGSPDPGGYFAVFDGSTITASNNMNLSYFANPDVDRALHRAAGLVGPRRYEAYAQIERALEQEYAPAIAFSSNASRDFFSARIGCQIYQPVFGMDLGALCLRSK